MSTPSLTRRAALAGLSMGLAGAIWLPSLQRVFAPEDGDLAPDGPLARALLTRQLALWEGGDDADISLARATNAEWDFMGRTFLVLSLANLALAEPADAPRYLAVIDRILDDTLRTEQQEGMFHFLMPYAKDGPFRIKPARSLFIDGEIALCLAARLLVADDRGFRILLNGRVQEMLAIMETAPALSGESYPDECWTFCNAVALAAVRLTDRALNQDHSEFLYEWVRAAKRRLLHAETGLLVSSYTYDGDHLDGPEGSSIWMVAHCLQLVDPELARDQYERARAELGRTILGFGYAREWPGSWKGPADIDSGPIVPVLEASAGASGLALLGARAFGDDDYLEALVTSLEFAAFPVASQGGKAYAASNVVGDAVMLYALTAGPLWAKALEPVPDNPMREETRKAREARAKAARAKAGQTGPVRDHRGKFQVGERRDKAKGGRP